LGGQHEQLSHFVVSLSIVLTVPQSTGFFGSWLVVLFAAQLIKAQSPNIRQATINAFFMERPSLFSHSLDGCSLAGEGSIPAASY
jgi:hypothetical protein